MKEYISLDDFISQFYETFKKQVNSILTNIFQKIQKMKYPLNELG